MALHGVLAYLLHGGDCEPGVRLYPHHLIIQSPSIPVPICPDLSRTLLSRQTGSAQKAAMASALTYKDCVRRMSREEEPTITSKLPCTSCQSSASTDHTEKSRLVSTNDAPRRRRGLTCTSDRGAGLGSRFTSQK